MANAFLSYLYFTSQTYIISLTMFVSIAGSVLSYNYKDEIAQAYCASKIRTGPLDIVSAVRRDCEAKDDSGAAITCQTICSNSTYPFRMTVLERMDEFSDQTYNFFNCFAGLWIWPDHPTLAQNPGPGQTDAGLLNMISISYDGAAACPATGCGPNYCCCLAAYI